MPVLRCVRMLAQQQLEDNAMLLWNVGGRVAQMSKECSRHRSRFLTIGPE